MTTQTMDNKDRLATIKSAQNALVYDLIMQALRAAIASKTHLSVWADKDGDLMVNAHDNRKRSYIQFSDDIKSSDIDDLIGIVEWLLNGAPEEDEPEEGEE